jgi:hypothetical protein
MRIKSLLAAACIFASMQFAASAQTRTIEHEYSEFDAVCVSSGFKVKLIQEDGYNAKFRVSDALESYLQCYVKAKTLYISLDEKAVPKEVKKQFKGKNTEDMVLEATVYVRTLNTITLSDDCTFEANQDLSSDNFTLDLTDNSSISNLNVSAEKAKISVSKKAKLSSIQVKADEVSVVGEGNGTLGLEYAAKKLSVNNSGSADLKINGDASSISVTVAGGSKLSLSGKADELKVSGKGSSAKIDAASVSVDDVTVSLDAADLTVAPRKKLSLDLGRGASVTYSGDPTIDIVKIQSASVTRK